MKISTLLCMALLAVTFNTHAVADYRYRTASFEVTITNLSKSSALTPIMVAAHHSKVKIFELGKQPSEALVVLAETGNSSNLTAAYNGQNDQVVLTSGQLRAGESVTLKFDNIAKNSRFSLASMGLPTNDAFIAVQSVRLPSWKQQRTIRLTAYDAGSETNDESCNNIPGPTCGGAALSPNDTGEGYVYVHSGIHGIADLSASQYTWQNPIAIVTIKRITR